jgi:hypothetical protein
VFAVGTPHGLTRTVTRGIVSNKNRHFEDPRAINGYETGTFNTWLQTDAAINPGNSGGPMLDDQRRIIAVTTCKLNAADAVGFGIPVADVRQFIDEFRAQQVDFGVQCPTCEELLDRALRYCPSCGSDLETHHDFGAYFETPEAHPLTDFVERALAASNIDPVLARHGSHNWSFHVGSAPIKIWACCSEHLNFSSPMAQTPSKGLNELFRYLLSAEHAPCAFDLLGSTVRLNLVIHISDVFAPSAHQQLVERVRDFIAKADASDNLLISRYRCQPAPETQVNGLKGSEHPQD